MHAIILAGGFGTRLRTVVGDVPKPMAMIQDRPFLAYLLHYLKQQGFTSIIFSVHYLYEKIQNYFGERYLDMPISYAIENEPLGTGGAIVNSFTQLPEKKPVFIINGDTFVQIDYQAMYAQHLNNHAKLTLALRKVDDCSRYGEVRMHNQLAAAFHYPGSSQPGLITTGIYAMNANLFADYTLQKKFSFEKDFLQPNIAILKPQIFITDDYFIDIGVPEDYQRAKQELNQYFFPIK